MVRAVHALYPEALAGDSIAESALQLALAFRLPDPLIELIYNLDPDAIFCEDPNNDTLPMHTLLDDLSHVGTRMSTLNLLMDLCAEIVEYRGFHGNQNLFEVTFSKKLNTVDSTVIRTYSKWHFLRSAGRKC